MKIHQFGSHWKNPWLPLEKSTIAPQKQKNPFDAYENKLTVPCINLAFTQQFN